MNGLHTESLRPAIAPRWLEFLDLYVAKRVPSVEPLLAVAPVLGAAIWETGAITIGPDRFVGATYDEALAAFEADDPVEVLFEEGADGSGAVGADAVVVDRFASWPVPAAETTSWYLGADGTTHRHGSANRRRIDSYTADPASVPEGYFDETSGGNIWSVDAQFD